MTDKELRHLNRGELLQLLITQGEENRRLKEQLDEANQKLNERQLIMKNAGSIAEAALRLNGVFEAAEKAAQQYIDSVAVMCRMSEETVDTSSAFSLEDWNTVPAGKDGEMSVEEYWQQVQKRARALMENNE